MYDDVLLPVDGSSGAEAAIVRALDLARVEGATLHTLHEVDTGPEPPGLGADDRAALRRAAEGRGRRATAAVEERAEGYGLRTAREVREGDPYRRILEYVGEAGIDLVVMGTHGRYGDERSRVGSTAERVVALADVPVLTVRRADTEAGAEAEVPRSGYGMYDRVVVATDGSDAAERAAGHGIVIAERYGADVDVVYVVDTAVYELSDAERSIVGLLERGGERAVEAVATEARDRNLPVDTNVLRGDPARTLLEYADGVGTDLLTLGTRGLAGVGERFLGSTTRQVLGRSDYPVLTVR